jgi:hypothetical protein
MAAKLFLALVVIQFAPSFAVPARADSDGYYCVGGKYLAYQFGFAAPSATPHRLFVVWLGDPGVIAQPAVFDLPQFQVHGMICEEGRILVAAFDRLYTVSLGGRGQPNTISETRYERPGAFPMDVSSRQRNLGAWSRPVNTLQAERVSLSTPASGTEIVLEITPRAAAERCVTQITARVVMFGPSGQVAGDLTVFQGQGRRECGGSPDPAAAAGDRGRRNTLICND